MYNYTTTNYLYTFTCLYMSYTYACLLVFQYLNYLFAYMYILYIYIGVWMGEWKAFVKHFRVPWRYWKYISAVHLPLGIYINIKRAFCSPYNYSGLSAWLWQLLFMSLSLSLYIFYISFWAQLVKAISLPMFLFLASVATF